jgi:hypothetical protein
MGLEQQLAGWTGPSSDTEQDKQDRTERMVCDAIAARPAFENCGLRVYAKGSYPNETNVRTDSDVDIAVQCTDVAYWEEQSPGAHPASNSSYTGPWTPSKLRAEVEAALRAKFGDQVDASGTTAIRVNSSSARVDADVVPCFTYRYYFTSGATREGTRIYRKNGTYLQNYPAQHLANGRAKQTATGDAFKSVVRILKRAENAMVTDDYHREVQSFFIESLVYNCPSSLFSGTWTEMVRRVVAHIWDQLQGDTDPDADRWVEVNDVKYLFHSSQPWTREDGREFAYAVWNYLGLKA